MFTQVKEIKKIESDENLKVNRKEQTQIRFELEELKSERSQKQTLTIPRKFSWLARHIFQRKQFRQAHEDAAKFEAEVTFLEEEIIRKEYELDVSQSNEKRIKSLATKIDVANNFEELGYTDINEITDLLGENNKEIILERNDVVSQLVSPVLRDTSQLLLIHKTNTIPYSGKILPKSETDLIRRSVAIGEVYPVILDLKDPESTVHFTVNAIDKENETDYAILVKYDELDKSRVVSGLPDDFFLDSAVNIPEGAVIIVPKGKLNNIDREKLKGIEVIGYEDDENSENSLTLDEAISLYMFNHSYYEHELGAFGWRDSRILHGYQDLVEDDIEEKSKVKAQNKINASYNLPFDSGVFPPYIGTKYFDESRQSIDIQIFVKAVDYLYDNMDLFEIEKKELKTKNTAVYNNKLLRAVPSDSSQDLVDDAFKNFIQYLKDENLEKISEYISHLDSKYISDKEDFVEQLSKSMRRVENERPARNVFFKALFEKFIELKDLEKSNEQNKKEEAKDNKEVNTEIDKVEESPSILVEEIEGTTIEEKDSKEEIEDDSDIVVISPKVEKPKETNVLDDKEEISDYLSSITEDDDSKEDKQIEVE